MSKKKSNLESSWSPDPKRKRVFSPEFKKAKVDEILRKQVSVSQVSDIYNVTRSAIYKWIYKYSSLERPAKMVVELESESLRVKRLLEQVAELERAVGQKQLEIDYLNVTLQISSEEVGYDLKKKHGPKSSNTSVISPKKKES